MARLGLKARYPKRFKVATDSNHNEAISPNSLDRQFEAKAPNQVWTTDITYIWTLEGWLYLAVVIDLYSRQVVGWAAADHMRTSICASALHMAFLPTDTVLKVNMEYHSQVDREYVFLIRQSINEPISS